MNRYHFGSRSVGAAVLGLLFLLGSDRAGAAEQAVSEVSESVSAPARNKPPAHESVGAIQPELQWIGSDGMSGILPFRYSGRWELKRMAADGSGLAAWAPVYRLEIQNPGGFTLESFTPEESDPHFQKQSMDGVTALDINRRLSRYHVQWVSSEGGERKTLEGSLLVRFNASAPALWTMDACRELGFRWDPVNKGRVNESDYSPLFLSVSDCELSKSGALIASIAWPQDAALISASQKKKLKKSNSTATSTSLPSASGEGTSAPSEILEAADVMAKIHFPRKMELQLQERQSLNSVRSFVIGAVVERNPKAPRFSGSAGAGLSFLAYSEEPFGIEKSFLAATVKGGVNYWIQPSHLDIAVSGYFSGSALGLGSSPAGESQPNAHFYGINFRTGYQLTPEQHRLGYWSLKASVGYYIWGMITPPLTYGVNFASGPQFFLSLSGSPERRPWGVYFKVAPISDDPLAASLRSRELAVGGSLRVNWLGKKQPWTLFVDLAQTEMRFTQAINEIGLTVVSVSLGRPF